MLDIDESDIDRDIIGYYYALSENYNPSNYAYRISNCTNQYNPLSNYNSNLHYEENTTVTNINFFTYIPQSKEHSTYALNPLQY